MKNYLIAAYDSEEKLLKAARELVHRKIPIRDIFTPYPIHEIDSLLKIKRSRLGLVCFFAGLGGFSLAMGFQLWVFTLSWPIIVGGKPYNAVPAFMPVAFECTILIGGLVTVAAFFFRSRLFPGKNLSLPHRDISNHVFALAIPMVDASLDGKEIQNFLRGTGVIHLGEEELAI